MSPWVFVCDLLYPISSPVRLGRHGYLSCRTEGELCFRRKGDVLFAAGISPGRTSSGPNARADRGSLPTAGDRTNEGACPGASTDEREVSLGMALTLRRDGTCFNIDPLPTFRLDGIEAQPQKSGILQPSRVFRSTITGVASSASNSSPGFADLLLIV